jgi:hypothetical protein
MGQTSVATLAFLLGHLRWCLDQPLADGPRDWGVRVSRTVDRVDGAFDRHVALLEDADGPLNRIADPSLFPFTAEAQQVRRLRQEHASLRTQIRCVGELFRECLVLFRPSPELSLRSAAADELAEARALRLFIVLGPCVGDVLASLEHHLAAEKKLLGHTAPACTSDEGVLAGAG